MKFLAFFFICSVFLSSLAFAEQVPFNQCIEVRNPEGSINDSLDCYFNDQLGVYNDTLMTLQGSQYCFNVSYHYNQGSYSFFSRCTDTTFNNSVVGSFDINVPHTGSLAASVSDVSFKEKVITFVRNNPFPDLVIAVCLIALFNVFFGGKQ